MFRELISIVPIFTLSNTISKINFIFKVGLVCRRRIDTLATELRELAEGSLVSESRDFSVKTCTPVRSSPNGDKLRQCPGSLLLYSGLSADRSLDQKGIYR